MWRGEAEREFLARKKTIMCNCTNGTKKQEIENCICRKHYLGAMLVRAFITRNLYVDQIFWKCARYNSQQATQAVHKLCNTIICGRFNVSTISVMYVFCCCCCCSFRLHRHRTKNGVVFIRVQMARRY